MPGAIPDTHIPAQRERSAPGLRLAALWPVVLAAAGIRLGALWAGGDFEPATGIERAYVSTAAALVSGYGLLMDTQTAAAIGHGFDPPRNSIEYMKERQAAGGRIDRQHPFPRSPEAWVPATLHPHGYSLLIAGLYAVGNYTGMIWSLRLIQIAADALACVFVFIFARNLFGERLGRLASWLYALWPPAVFLSFALLLPDAFTGFFVSLVLALASFTSAGRDRRVLYAGIVLGVGCHFRTEYILLPAVLFPAFWATSGRLVPALRSTAALAGPMLLVLLPFALWMTWRVGEFRFTSTNGGGVAYSSLGEDVSNPWGIVYRDQAMHVDALSRGFPSAWSAAANRYYTSRFIEYVRTYPHRYLKTVLFHRLPFALAPPYGTWSNRDANEFTFSRYREAEGLSRWGVVRKYPFTVLRNMWPQMVMLLCSGTLTLSVAAVVILQRRDWQRLTWIFLPWAYTVVTIVLLKGIEPRNLAPTLIPGIVALALVIRRVRDRNVGRPRPALRAA